MDKFVKEGAIFSIIVFVVMFLLNLLFTVYWTSPRVITRGFPFIYEDYKIFYPINWIADMIIIPIILGFGISYIKNKMVKK